MPIPKSARTATFCAATQMLPSPAWVAAEVITPEMEPPAVSAALIPAVRWPARTTTRAAPDGLALPGYHWVA